MLVQPNGRIVVAGGGAAAGSFCVARLRTNGALDTTFGSGGKRVIDFGGDDEAVYGAALQPDGKIVLAGASDLRVAVARLNPNGSLDTTFSGDGKKIFSPRSTSAATTSACDGAPGQRAYPRGRSSAGGAVVARLRTNGTLDPDFDGDGRLTLPGAAARPSASAATCSGWLAHAVTLPAL